MDSNLETIIATDFDGTIFPDVALARFLTDYATQNKKLGILFSYPAIKLYILTVKTIGKIIGYKTGETSSMSIADLILRKYNIPYSFLDREAKKFSNMIPRRYVKAINESDIPILVITSEPKELVEKIFDYSKIEVYDILGNEFDMNSNWIIGFNRDNLLAGPRGKYYRLKLFLSNHSNTKVISVGDTISDIVGVEHYTVSKDMKKLDDCTYKEDLVEVIKSISQKKIQN